MVTDALKATVTPRAKRTLDGKIAAPPNYILLTLGIALVLVQIFFVSGRVQSPVANAALLALGVTLALYGIYPVSVMKGEFTGLLGTLAVTGPAALGLFVFAYTLDSLKEEVNAEDPVLLTTSATDQRHNSRKIGDTTIRLLDVDSFSDEGITDVIGKLDSGLQNNNVSDVNERRQEVRRLLASVIPQLRLGQPHQAKALAAVDASLSGQPDANVNQAWNTAVTEAAAGARDARQVVNRVKRLPFALMKVTEKSRSRFLILSEGGQLPVGSRTYDVPVIANPSKKYTPGLEEAVALTTAVQ